jgi:hypothetical protein
MIGWIVTLMLLVQENVLESAGRQRHVASTHLRRKLYAFAPLIFIFDKSHLGIRTTIGRHYPREKK